jgi:hypothetical protein
VGNSLWLLTYGNQMQSHKLSSATGLSLQKLVTLPVQVFIPKSKTVIHLEDALTVRM